MKRITNEKQLIKEILENTPDIYEKEVLNAIEFARKYHANELRLSGEPFHIHALNVGRYCSLIGLDTDSIITGIIHQTVSKKFKTEQQISEIFKEVKEIFGNEVLELLIAVATITEYTNIKYGTDFSVLKKYLMGGGEDIRPTLIKICDVLDDCQSFESLKTEKQSGFAQKILNVYSPLCEYFNLSKFKTTMEEEVFKVISPEDFNSIQKLFEDNNLTDQTIEKYNEYLNTIVKDILGYESEIYGRRKGIYSTYNKLKKYVKEGKSNDLSQIKDIVAFTILGKTIQDCYEILHALQSLCLNDPNNFDDYILIPKPNGYSAIHACVQIPEISNTWVEVQIMTDEMHYTNTYGPASHIAYKAARERFAKATKEHNWVEELHNAIQKNRNERETQRSIPISGDFLKNRIFVQTPKGKIIELEQGSTAVDFAFRIHSDIGRSAVSAILNGKQCKLSQELKTGDIVEVVGRKGKNIPDKEWLLFAKSLRTKKYIRESLK